MDTMQLGGNIELTGFNNVNKSQLVVLKKIVGNYVKEFSEKMKFEKLSLSMTMEGDEYRVVVELGGDKPIKSEIKDKNLFFVVGNILENMKKQL